MGPQSNSKGPWNGKRVRIESGRIFFVRFPDPIGEHVAVVTLAREHDYVEVVYGVSEPRRNGDRDEYVIRHDTIEAKPFMPWIRHDTHFRVEHVAIVTAAMVGDLVGTGRVLAVPTQPNLEKIARAAREASVVRDLRPAPSAPSPSKTPPSE
jgi:hypothetical protein